MTDPESELARCKADMREALMGIEESNAEIAVINEHYMSMVGKPRHGQAPLSYEEAHIMRKKDEKRKELAGDREFYKTNVIAFGIAALVIMDDLP